MQNDDYQVVLIGDSDIAFWPRELYPNGVVGSASSSCFISRPPLVRGQSGATLAETLPQLRSIVDEHAESEKSNVPLFSPSSSSGTSSLIIVACAGENDIGNGIILERSVSALREFLAIACETEGAPESSRLHRYVIFLGPKFEPWLEEDHDCKGQYSAMSRAFERCCREYETDHAATDAASSSQQIHYVDCLTMFCGETAHVPGAVLAGRAKAEKRFFESDQLHLSNEGYDVWKSVVERIIHERILCQGREHR